MLMDALEDDTDKLDEANNANDFDAALGEIFAMIEGFAGPAHKKWDI